MRYPCFLTEKVLKVTFILFCQKNSTEINRGYFWAERCLRFCITKCLHTYIHTCNFTSVRGSSEQSLQRGWLFPPLPLCGTIRCHVNMVIAHVMCHIKGRAWSTIFPSDHNWVKCFLKSESSISRFPVDVVEIKFHFRNAKTFWNALKTTFHYYYSPSEPCTMDP